MKDILGYFVAQQPMPTSPTHHGSSHSVFFQGHSDPNQIPPQYSAQLHSTSPPNNYNNQHNQSYGLNCGSNSNTSPYHVEIPPSNTVKKF